MMRSGSMFAKYCRREISSSGSRHYYTTKDGVRQVENLEEAREVAREILVKITLGGIKRLFFKTAIAFAGYKTALSLSTYDPEKYASEIAVLREKNRLLNADMEALLMKNSN